MTAFAARCARVRGHALAVWLSVVVGLTGCVGGVTGEFPGLDAVGGALRLAG